MSKANFGAWFNEVNKCVERICGLSAEDLSDQPYNDWFNDGYTPQEAAHECLSDNGWEGEGDED